MSSDFQNTIDGTAAVVNVIMVNFGWRFQA
jgi:hypothetical protein